MGGMLYASHSIHFLPCSALGIRCRVRKDPLHSLRFRTNVTPFKAGLSSTSLSVNLRPRSTIICGNSSKSQPRSTTISADELSLREECGEAANSSESSVPPSQTCLDSVRAVGSSGFQGMTMAFSGMRTFCCCLQMCLPVVNHQFLSRIKRTREITAQSWLVHLAKVCGKVLLVGLVFIMLDLSPSRTVLRHALAAPSTTSTESKKKLSSKEEKSARRDGRPERRESGEEESQRWESDSEQVIQEAAVTQDRFGGLNSMENENEFEKIILKDVNDRLSQATALNEVEECLKIVQREEARLGKKMDNAVAEFFSAKADLDGLGKDVSRTKRLAKERLKQEKLNVLVSHRKRLADVREALRNIARRVKQITWTRQPVVEQVKPSKLSKITADLEEWKRTEREIRLLPLAAKVEVDDASKTDWDVAIEQQAKQEQLITQKLMDIFEKLVSGLDKNTRKRNPELEKSLLEVCDLILDESRWQGGDENSSGPDAEVLHAVVNLRRKLGKTDPKLEMYLHEVKVEKSLSEEDKEKILVARDNVLQDTWYDEKTKRWEMKPDAALQAVQLKLAGRARIRKDRRVMYLALKGDEREYFVNAQKFDAEYEDYGGFYTLYLKLLASGVPTSVEVMPIPLQEWEASQLLKLPFKMVWLLLEDVWNSGFVVAVRPWYYKNLLGAFEEVMIRFGFPVIQKIMPPKMRIALGFQLPEGAEAAEPTNIISWQQEAQKHVDARYAEGSGSPAWWISLPLRCYMVGLPLLIVLKFVLGVVITPLKPEPLAMNEVEWKEKKQKELEKQLEPQTKKQAIDPIKHVFDKMKRVKRPTVSLKDFAGIDTIKDEISEIISFLKNPNLFREMGARPPRGVLIVGESGTGKTTLALAIAAEARVPMVELQGSELEGGAWVGQGASNVRELFKTARELAPLIIFMDDFDHFAGVRGATSDTRKQDHESLINQLLVELDGFETQEGVVLVATTSRPHAIDEALRRPGRMDRTINLPMPNKREREQILLQAAHKTMDAHLIDYVDWSKVAEKTAGLTPAHLKYVPEGLEGSAVSNKIADEEELFFIFQWLLAINKISPRWVKESKWTKRYNDWLIDWLGLRVTREDLESAVQYMDVFWESKPGMEFVDPPYVWTREFKYPHAVWAVGKGLLALLLPDFDEVEQIWLDPTSWEGIAFTKLSRKWDGGYEETRTFTRSYYEKELVSYFGSVVASRMLLKFGQNNSLSKFEIQNAKEVATRMVMEYGWADDDSPMVYLTDGSEITMAFGDQHELELAKKINKLFYTAHEKATSILEQNRPTLEAMLEHLLEFDCLSNQDMQRILDETEAVFEPSPFVLHPPPHVEIGAVSTNGTGRLAKESTVSAVI